MYIILLYSDEVPITIILFLRGDCQVSKINKSYVFHSLMGKKTIKRQDLRGCGKEKINNLSASKKIKMFDNIKRFHFSAKNFVFVF